MYHCDSEGLAHRSQSHRGVLSSWEYSSWKNRVPDMHTTLGLSLSTAKRNKVTDMFQATCFMCNAKKHTFGCNL